MHKMLIIVFILFNVPLFSAADAKLAVSQQVTAQAQPIGTRANPTRIDTLEQQKALAEEWLGKPHTTLPENLYLLKGDTQIELVRSGMYGFNLAYCSKEGIEGSIEGIEVPIIRPIHKIGLLRVTLDEQRHIYDYFMEHTHIIQTTTHNLLQTTTITTEHLTQTDGTVTKKVLSSMLKYNKRNIALFVAMTACAAYKVVSRYAPAIRKLLTTVPKMPMTV